LIFPPELVEGMDSSAGALKICKTMKKKMSSVAAPRIRAPLGKAILE
jgi:hypothetical protein